MNYRECVIGPIYTPRVLGAVMSFLEGMGDDIFYHEIKKSMRDSLSLEYRCGTWRLSDKEPTLILEVE